MELAGTLLNLHTYGQWARGTLSTPDGTSVQVVGRALAGLVEQRNYLMEGRTRSHPKYGPQFEVERARLNQVVDRERLIRDLQAQYAGCGEKTAKKIVGVFDGQGSGIDALAEILELRPWELEAAEAITGKKLTYIGPIRVSPEAKVMRTLQSRLGKAWVSEYALNRLVSWLAASVGGLVDGSEHKAIRALEEDPFRAMFEVDGYGFDEAERLARAFGLPWSHESRLAAMAYEGVQRVGARGGHSFVMLSQFEAALRDLEPRARVGDCLDAAARLRYPVSREEDRLYLAAVRGAEQRVAAAFSEMVGPGRCLWDGSRDELLERIAILEEDVGVVLDESQKQALVGILTSTCRLHTLTAGPGCGKTTVMEMFAALLPDLLFSAPTGKAAKVLSMRVEKYGQVAQTVHAMLDATGEGFRKGRSDPLQCKLVVVDEAGMEDLFVCAALVEAMPVGAHLLLVGDVDQLDSVGEGRVLADAVELVEADHHRLDTPHRSRKGILQFIRELRNGVIPIDPPDDTVRYFGFDSEGATNFEAVTDLWLESVTKRGLDNVALLFGFRKGSPDRAGLNVTYANAALQGLVNPEEPGNKIPGTHIRVEDRVLVRRNLTLRRRNGSGVEHIYGQLVNGDSGYVKSFKRTPEARLDCLLLRMDDGRELELPAVHVSKLDLAYAQTVHSAQGSEYDEVIFCVRGRGNEFMNRRLLYTGCSRAKKRLTIVGQRGDVESIAQYVASSRQSSLGTRIQQIWEKVDG